MEFAFKNVDKKYMKVRSEPVGDIQPKFWYSERYDSSKKFLLKRQFSQKVSGQPAKSKMFNHFGEYFGYLLGEKAGVAVCPVDLVTVHDTKNKYSKTKRIFTGCASHSLRKNGEEIFPGELVVSKFRMRNPKRTEEILDTPDNSILNLEKGNISTNDYDDNVDLVIAAIVAETKEYEEKMGCRTAEQIKEDVDTNIRAAIEMVVYDCIFGNSDRHSQNWAMVYDPKLGTVRMYPNYDNEAVLGLRKTEYEIKEAVRKISGVSEFSKNELFSRMGFSPINSGVTYQNMLEHLINKYPSYTVPAMQRMTDLVTEKDIDDLYQASEGITFRSEDKEELSNDAELPVAFRVFGTRLYHERREFARELLRRYKEKQEYKKREKEVVD